MDKLIKKLNPEQRDAVTTDAKKALVVAGPGSGKTRVLTHRLAYLVEKGANPRDIVALTFTNKAAKELKNRAVSLSRHSESSFLGTFHSFGANFLRKTLSKVDLLNLNNNFTILDHSDQKRLIKQVLDSLEVNSTAKSISKYENFLTESKSRQKFTDSELWSFIEERLEFKPDYDKQVSFEFLKKIRNETWGSNLLDFTDLIALPVKILSENKELRREWQEKTSFLLVDEWQDTNVLQYNFAKLLSQPNHFFSVGDPDQSIYSWRGAEIENLFRLKNDFPDLEIFKLTRNYRSTKEILKVANEILKVKSFEERELESQTEDGKPVVFSEHKTQEDEARFVVSKIKSLREDHFIEFYSEAAVLYRTNAQSRSLEESFINTCVPYKIVKGLKFFDRAEVKSMMSYLRFFANSRDNMSFERMIAAPKRGIGKGSLQKLLTHGQGSYIAGLDNLSSFVSGRVLEKFEKLRLQIDTLKSLSEKLLFSELVEEIYEKVKFGDYIDSLSETEDEVEMRKENIFELIHFASKFNFSKNPLQDFLERVSLLTSDEMVEDGDSVKLMSFHAAKGLEFPVVFLVGVNEKILPHKQSLEEGNIDEERRLFFVGVTRAMEQLFITWFRKTSFALFGPSRFLKEIGALDEINFSFESDNPWSSRFKKFAFEGESQLKSRDFSSENQLLSVGQVVKHEIFGKGVITEIDGEKVAVKFGGSIKILLKKFAKLEILEF